MVCTVGLIDELVAIYAIIQYNYKVSQAPGDPPGESTERFSRKSRREGLYCSLIYELVVTYPFIQYNYKVSQTPRKVPVISFFKSLHEGTGCRDQCLL